MLRSSVVLLVGAVFVVGCTSLSDALPEDSGAKDSAAGTPDAATDKGGDARPDGAADQAQDQVDLHPDAPADAPADTGSVDASDAKLPDGGDAATTPAMLALAPAPGSSTAYGNVGVGFSIDQTFTVSNGGQQTSSAVTISLSGAGFFLLPAAAGDCVSGTTTLAPAASCTVRVRLMPAAAGTAMGMLSASATAGGSASLTLTGNGQTGPTLALRAASGSSAAFGTVTVGASADQTFVLSNDGQQATSAPTITVTGAGFTRVPAVSADCGSGSALASGTMCTIMVRFAPTAASTGPVMATLQATATTGGTASLTLTGTGQTAAALKLAPAGGSSTGYANVTVGTSKDQTFVLSNSGQQTSTAVTLSLTTGTGFTILAPAGADCVSGTTTLAAGATCSIRVHFAPSAEGIANATLGAMASTGGMAMLGLVGVGDPAAKLSLAPGTTFSADFGGIVVNGSMTQTFVLSNAGPQATTAITFSLDQGSSTDFRMFSPLGGDCMNGTTTLAAGASCNIRIQFGPTVQGLATAVLSASATTGGSTMLTLTGTGQNEAALQLAPAAGSSSSFGIVPLGGMAQQTFVVTNSGDQTSGAVTLILPAGPFITLPPAAGECASTTMLAGGASCTFRVRFTPSGLAPASVMLTATAIPGGQATLTLTGTSQ